MSVIKTFQQLPWHGYHDVAIHTGAIVTVDGIGVLNDREQALAWIILRLNAEVIALREKIAVMEKKSLDKPPQISYATLVNNEIRKTRKYE